MNANFLPCFKTNEIHNYDSFWGNCKKIYLYKYFIILLDEDICSICQQTKEIKTRGDSCNHSFCFKCILAWVRIKNVCPLCKKQIMKLIRI